VKRYRFCSSEKLHFKSHLDTTLCHLSHKCLKTFNTLVTAHNNFSHFCFCSASLDFFITTKAVLQNKYVWTKESKHCMICWIKSMLCLQIFWRLFLNPVSFLCWQSRETFLQIFDLRDNDVYCLFDHQSNMNIKWPNKTQQNISHMLHTNNICKMQI